MTVNPGLFSSKTDNWATPQDFFDKLNAEFHFTLDVCADETNAKCQHYFGYGSGMFADGLSYKWHGRCYMNPPYGRQIGRWVQKARDATYYTKEADVVVALLPARTDTRWWHAYIWDEDRNCPRPGVEVRFVRGRLKFGDSKNSAPFPSAVVIFRSIGQ